MQTDYQELEAVKGRNVLVEEDAEIGSGTKIWHNTVIRSTARIGKGCTIGSGCEVGGVVGDNCHIQNGVYLYEGIFLEDNVFVAPGVAFTNVRNPDPKSIAAGRRGTINPTYVEQYAMIGANATIICGARIGKHAHIGAGSVVTSRYVPPGEMWIGNPARKWERDEEGFLILWQRETGILTLQQGRVSLHTTLKDFFAASGITLEDIKRVLAAEYKAREEADDGNQGPDIRTDGEGGKDG